MSKSTIVRRPDYASGGLTADEKASMAEHAQLWIKRALRTDPIEPDKIVPAIEGIYAAAGLARPRVVTVPSPLVMAVAYGFSAAIWYRRRHPAATRDATEAATRDATDAATRAATDAATRAATGAATEDATRAATAAATEDATDAATWAATGAATWAATGAATRDATAAATEAATRDATRAATHAATAAATEDATEDATHAATRAGGWIVSLAKHLGGEDYRFFVACAASWANAYQGGNMWAAWESYLTAARDILGLRLAPHSAYAAWEQAAIEGGFRCLHEKFCIISDFPEILRIDDQNRPHCENGPSHRWRDGWSLYHWHGVRVPAEWIEKKADLTPQMALGQGNVELRRAACEILGWDRILGELNARRIDRDPDPEIGELLEVNLPDSGRARFLRVLCGTGRQFAIPVPLEIQTALEGNAWTYDIPPSLLQQKETRT